MLIGVYLPTVCFIPASKAENYSCAEKGIVSQVFEVFITVIQMADIVVSLADHAFVAGEVGEVEKTPDAVHRCRGSIKDE